MVITWVAPPMVATASKSTPGLSEKQSRPVTDADPQRACLRVLGIRSCECRQSRKKPDASSSAQGAGLLQSSISAASRSNNKRGTTGLQEDAAKRWKKKVGYIVKVTERVAE